MLVGFASRNQRKQMPFWFFYLVQELPECISKTFFSKIVKYLEQLGILFCWRVARLVVWYKVP